MTGSDRAQLVGMAQQAWLLKRVVHVMNLVSEEYDQPWWRSKRSWFLVFRSCFYLIKQYKPISSAEATKTLSPAGETEIGRWNEIYKASERERLEQDYDRVGFSIATVALKDEYAAKRVAQPSAPAPDPAPLPELNRADMEVWQKDREDEEKYIEAWRQVLPTLRATRTRRRKQRIR